MSCVTCVGPTQFDCVACPVDQRKMLQPAVAGATSGQCVCAAGTFVSNGQCLPCDSTCKTNNPPDCCADYDTTCGKGGPTTCTPQCTGKKCGPDGCNKGGNCGVCGAGAVCDNAGQCLGGTSPTADAGGTGADASKPTGGIDAGNGADVGTTIIYTSAPAKSGCSAGGSPVAPGSLALLMLGLGLAVVLRRRQA